MCILRIQHLQDLSIALRIVVELVSFFAWSCGLVSGNLKMPDCTPTWYHIF